MDTTPDVDYQKALGSRSYIAPVSPWFFTHLPTTADFGALGAAIFECVSFSRKPKESSCIGRNWLFVSDTLFYDRWEEILKLQPPPTMVEMGMS